MLETRFDTYEQFKHELDQEFHKSVEGFVKIGYLLKYARETDILYNSGYKSLTEFAQAEYHIDASQVTRFIQINDQFSEGGNSMVLKERYRGFGYAKLTIMLQLPEEINEELTPDFSKREIQMIQEEIKEEAKTSDLEVILEGEREEQKEFNTLGKAMHQLLEDDPDLFLDLWKVPREIKNVKEVLAPTGEGMKTVRLQGVGRIMISFKESGINVISVRTNEKESFSWENLLELLGENDGTDGKEKWTSIYKTPFPEKIAPVQPQPPKPADTKKSRKELKVTKAKVTPKPKPKPEPQPEPQPEAQLPGQTSIEQDFPEYMTKPSSNEADNPKEEKNLKNETESGGNETKTEENETENKETVTVDTETPHLFIELALEDISKKREEYKAAVSLRLEDAGKEVEGDMYLLAISELREAISLIEKLQQLEDREGELNE